MQTDLKDKVLSTIREVMQTDHKTFMYHLPMPTQEDVYVRYPLEDGDGGALRAAHEKYENIMAIARKPLDAEIVNEISSKIPGVLPRTLES